MGEEVVSGVKGLWAQVVSSQAQRLFPRGASSLAVGCPLSRGVPQTFVRLGLSSGRPRWSEDILRLGAVTFTWDVPRRCLRWVAEVGAGAGRGAAPVGARREPSWVSGESGVRARPGRRPCGRQLVLCQVCVRGGGRVLYAGWSFVATWPG